MNLPGDSPPKAYFSIAPGQTSNPKLDPGEVYLTEFDGTYSLAFTRKQMGLSIEGTTENIDALETNAFGMVPEPATLALVGGALLIRRRR